MRNRWVFPILKRKRSYSIPKGFGCVVLIANLGFFTSSLALGNHLESHSIFEDHKTHEGPDVSLDPTLRRFLSLPEPQATQPPAAIIHPPQPYEKSTRSEADSEEAAGLSPMERGWKYLLTGRPEAALGAYRQALQNQPDSDMAYLGLGMAFKSLGNVEEAKQAITQALVHNPRLASALVHLGYLYADGQMGSPDSETARRLFQQASQMGDPFARIALLDLQTRLSRQEFTHSKA